MQMMFSYPGAILPKHLGTIALFPTTTAPSICKYGMLVRAKANSLTIAGRIQEYYLTVTADTPLYKTINPLVFANN